MRNVTIKGRLKPDVSMERAQTELSVIAKDLERAYPDTNRDRGLIVRTELQTRLAQSPPDAMLIAMLTTLAAAVLFVACANVAGLLDQPSPGARERNGDAGGRRRRTRPLDHTADDGEPPDRARRRRLGIAVGYGAVRCSGRFSCRRICPSRSPSSSIGGR